MVVITIIIIIFLGIISIIITDSIILIFCRDLQSPFSKLEEKAIKEDLCRPAVKLANELKKNTFPHVLLLDG